MKEYLKKNWFAAVVACIFLAITIYFIYDQNKNTLWGKTSGGSGVVYELDGEYVTADTLYDRYYIKGGEDAAYSVLARKLYASKVKTTDEMETEAQNLADQYLQYYESYYGTSASTIIQYSLDYMGYSTLEEYCLNSLKQEEFDRQYILANKDTFWAAFEEKYSPRIVSHCLIYMEDPDNPTEEEQASLDEAKEAWESGEYTFAEFAEKYSDDSSSAVNGGKIGYIDNESYGTYVTEFVDTALATEEGETSEWFKTEYGWHLMMVDSVQAEDCLAETGCVERMITMYPNMEKAAVWDALTEMNVKFSSEDLEKSVKEALGVNEDGVVENEPVSDEETEGN